MIAIPLRAAFTSLAMLVVISGAAQAKIAAVASFSILGDMVSRVGGDRIALTTLVGPNADTHVYEPKPSDAKAVAQADVLFINGLGFEGWMTRLVESAGYKGPVIVASDGIAPRKMEEDGEEVTDPHAFQDLANGIVYVKNIADGLCKADPEGCDGFRQNAQSYTAELQALDRGVRDRLAAVPADDRKVITSHDAFGYFGAAYDIEFLAPQGISTESEASAGEVARLIQQIKSSRVKALFIENMSDPRLIEQIGRETGVRAGGELYADALSTPEEGAATYVDMFRHNIALLAAAMTGS